MVSSKSHVDRQTGKLTTVTLAGACALRFKYTEPLIARGSIKVIEVYLSDKKSPFLPPFLYLSFCYYCSHTIVVSIVIIIVVVIRRQLSEYYCKWPAK